MSTYLDRAVEPKTGTGSDSGHTGDSQQSPHNECYHHPETKNISE